MSYETRRDYAHALQCLQARSLASGPSSLALTGLSRGSSRTWADRF